MEVEACSGPLLFTTWATSSPTEPCSQQSYLPSLQSKAMVLQEQFTPASAPPFKTPNDMVNNITNHHAHGVQFISGERRRRARALWVSWKRVQIYGTLQASEIDFFCDGKCSALTTRTSNEQHHVVRPPSASAAASMGHHKHRCMLLQTPPICSGRRIPMLNAAILSMVPPHTSWWRQPGSVGSYVPKSGSAVGSRVHRHRRRRTRCCTRSRHDVAWRSRSSREGEAEDENKKCTVRTVVRLPACR